MCIILLDLSCLALSSPRMSIVSSPCDLLLVSFIHDAISPLSFSPCHFLCYYRFNASVAYSPCSSPIIIHFSLFFFSSSSSSDPSNQSLSSAPSASSFSRRATKRCTVLDQIPDNSKYISVNCSRYPPPHSFVRLVFCVHSRLQYVPWPRCCVRACVYGRLGGMVRVTILLPS